MNLLEELDTVVPYSKQGGSVIDVTCQSSIKLLQKTSAVSLFTCLPIPTLLAARGINTLTSRSQSQSHAYLFCVLSHGFSSKRGTSRSLCFWLFVSKVQGRYLFLSLPWLALESDEVIDSHLNQFAVFTYCLPLSTVTHDQLNFLLCYSSLSFKFHYSPDRTCHHF